MAVLKPDTSRASDPGGRTLCAPTKRSGRAESHPIRPCGGQAAAGGPQTAAQRQRVPFGEEKQGSGRGMPARAFQDKADFASTSWPFLNRIQVGRSVWRAHTVRPYEAKRILSAPAGTSRRRGGPQTAAQPSGCRLGRRSKGAGEECPPGRSEIKRTLLRRHGGSQTGYKPGVRPGRAHTVRPYGEKRILSAPAGNKPPQAALKRQSQNKTQEAPRFSRGLLLYFLTVHQPSSPSSATKRTYRFKICRV